MSAIAFFHPQYLWALAGLALPIVIHLLFRRRTLALDFSSVRFLRTAAVKASRRRRLRRLLLLLVRLVLLALIVVLFAQPFDKDDPFQALWAPRARVYCWIDPTMSMDYRLDGVPLWQRAREQLSLIDSTLAPAARMLCYDEEQRAFVPPGHIAPEPRHGPADIDAMLAAFRRATDGSGTRSVLIVLSDFQTPTADFFDTLFTTDTLDYPVLGVMVNAPKPWNFGVGGTVIHGDKNAVATTNVYAVGRMLSDGEVAVRFGTMRAGHAVVDCEPAESLGVEMEVSFPPGEAAGEVRLRADDPFPADNVDYFVGDRAGSTRVLVIAENEASYPVIAALKAVRSKRFGEPVVRHPAAVTFEQIDEADVIVVSGVREPARGLQNLLQSTGLREKVILFSPSTDPVFTGWNNRVFAHLAMDSPQLVRVERPLFPVLPDTLSLLWRHFPRTAEHGAAVHEYYRPVRGSALLRFNNGAPLATMVSDERGHIWIVLATPLEITPANNLCETGFYVPFMDRVVHYALENLDEGGRTWYAGVGQRNPYYGSRRRARVFGADETFVAQWDMQQTVRLDEPGVYRVQPAGEPSYRVPVVIDPAETALHYRRPSVAEVNTHTVRVLDVAPFRDLLRNRRGALMLSLCWLAVGLLVALEALLWNWRREG